MTKWTELVFGVSVEGQLLCIRCGSNLPTEGRPSPGGGVLVLENFRLLPLLMLLVTYYESGSTRVCHVFFANTFYTVVSGVNTLLHLLSFLYVAVFTVPCVFSDLDCSYICVCYVTNRPTFAVWLNANTSILISIFSMWVYLNQMYWQKNFVLLANLTVCNFCNFPQS